MSVCEPKIIDFVSYGSNDRVTLTISDHLPWDSQNEHLLLLQDKLNSYLAFIESGELLEKFPESADLSPYIGLYLSHPPNADAEKFLSLSRTSIEAAGVGFIITLMPLLPDDTVA